MTIRWIDDRLPERSGTVAVVTDNDLRPRWMYFRSDTGHFHPHRGIWTNVGCPFKTRPPGHVDTPIVIAWCGLPEYP